MVESTWNWVDSPEAYAGLPTKAQADEIFRLKGSKTSTDKLITAATATLFKRFAKDWEAKNLILAPQPLPWATKRGEMQKPEDPAPLPETETEDEDRGDRIGG